MKDVINNKRMQRNRSTTQRVLFMVFGVCGFWFWPAAQITSVDIDELKASQQYRSTAVKHTDEAIQSSCIIVVGAFKRKENADRKVNYLAQKGLKDLYRGMHNGKEYLGVPIDCNTPDIDSYLEDFQYRYIADAWIYTISDK